MDELFNKLKIKTHSDVLHHLKCIWHDHLLENSSQVMEILEMHRQIQWSNGNWVLHTRRKEAYPDIILYVKNHENEFHIIKLAVMHKVCGNNFRYCISKKKNIDIHEVIEREENDFLIIKSTTTRHRANDTQEVAYYHQTVLQKIVGKGTPVYSYGIVAVIDPNEGTVIQWIKSDETERW